MRQKKRPNEQIYLSIAAEMTNQRVSDLPDILVQNLRKANDMCVATGGQLVSRQAIAAIIINSIK